VTQTPRTHGPRRICATHRGGSPRPCHRKPEPALPLPVYGVRGGVRGVSAALRLVATPPHPPSALTRDVDLSAEVGFIRLRPIKNAELGQARVSDARGERCTARVAAVSETTTFQGST
jgi:hypothetical protein